MMDALSAARCFQCMQALTRKQGQFTVQELVEAGFLDFQVRSFLTLCRSMRTIERRFDIAQHVGGARHAYRVIDNFPPLVLAPNDDVAAIAALVLNGLSTSARGREALDRQHRLWIALRGLRQATASELAFAASLADRPVTSRQSLMYLRDLEAAAKVTRSGERFRLLPRANSGPRPVLSVSGRILDLNLMRAVNVTASEPVNQGRVA